MQAALNRPWLHDCATAFVLAVAFVLHALQPVRAAETAPAEAPAVRLTAAERQWLAAHPGIRVATKQEWAPIDVYSYEGQFRGLSGDVLHLVEQRLGVRFEYIAMPSLADGLAALREGQVDVLPSVSRTPAREAFMRYTQPYLDVPNVYLARRGVGAVGQNESLEGMAVAAERGYAVIETIRERHPKARIVEFENSADALRGVSRGEADVYLGALPTTTFLVEKLLLTNLEIRGPWRTGLSALHLGVARDNTMLQIILDKALDSITLAERQEIHRRWVPLRTLLGEPAPPLPLSEEERRFVAQMPALRVGFDEAHYPYTFRGQDGRLTGMAQDYLALITQRLGLSVGAARGGTWPDVYDAARQGEVDLLVAVSDNTERRRDFLFVGPWISTPTVLVTRSEAPEVLDLRQLGDSRVGVLANGQHKYLLETLYPQLQLVPYPTREALLAAVLRGEVTGSFSNVSFVVPKLQEGYGASLKMAGMFPELNSDLYFAVRRDQPMLASLLARALASVSDGERAAVASHWAVIPQGGAPSAAQVLRRALPYLAALLLALGVSLGWALRLRRQVQRTRAAEAALGTARDEAMNLARARKEFITVASHEIRTPVNAVIGALDHLRRHADGPRRDEMLALAERSAATLREFVNNLLDLSKSDAGMLDIHLEAADLRPLLREAVHALQPVIGHKPVALELTIDEAMAPRLLADSMRLRQIVLNLLSNALKFTAQGRVELAVRVVSQDAGTQTLEVTVSDTGCGVPADKLETVFERYTQADATTAAHYGGTGLGLALCKRLVEAMGGSIELSSREGEGTRVRIVVRLARAAAPHAAARAEGLRVLLAEDDRVQQIVLVAMLEARGCTVDLANDGRQALALWRLHRHRLVLSDCRMPGHDGYTFAHALRLEPGGAGVRLVGMSADVDDAQAARSAGMDLLLQKPLADSALDDLLAGLPEAGREAAHEPQAAA